MDGLPNELLRNFAPECSDLLFPLLLKLVFRGTEAMGMKGGLAVWFHRGRGAKDVCESFRQLIEDPPPGQAVRPALRDLYVKQTPALQLGGKPGQSVCFDAHLVRAFRRWNQQLRRSCYVLFADIASPFYSARLGGGSSQSETTHRSWRSTRLAAAFNRQPLDSSINLAKRQVQLARSLQSILRLV